MKRTSWTFALNFLVATTLGLIVAPSAFASEIVFDSLSSTGTASRSVSGLFFPRSVKCKSINLSSCRLAARWAAFAPRSKRSSANPADGFSFCLGSDLSAPFGEEGSGTGLIVSFDTWDNGEEEAPCIDLKWNGATFAHAPRQIITGSPAAFVDVFIELTPAGQVTVRYAGATVHNAVPIPGYSPIPGDATFVNGSVPHNHIFH